METPQVYRVQYQLKNKLGEVVDSSEGGQPLVFMMGAGQVVQGVEEAVRGRAPGDCLEVTIPPEMAYGEHRPELVKRVPRSAFAGIEAIRPGMTFQTNTGDQAQVVKVAALDGDLVIVDANHPLAGFTLYFDLEIMEVRDATEEELAAGRAFS